MIRHVPVWLLMLLISITAAVALAEDASPPAVLPAAVSPAPASPAPAGPATPVPQDCSACHDTLGNSLHKAGCAGCHAGTEVGAGGHLTLTQRTCAECHEKVAANARHAPAKDGACTTCHDPHGRKKKNNYLARTEGLVCVSCHADVPVARYVHTEVKLGRCSSCHDPHGSANPNYLKDASPTAACARCHNDHADPEPYPHWPADQRRCDVCHDPHGSPYQGNLIAPPEKVCAQCHPPKDNRPQVHSAVKLGRCVACHDPHGSDYDRKLRGEPVAQVCFGCHYDDIDGRKVVHAPVFAGNCTMCHDPHTTDFPKNLRASVNTTCGSCHPDKLRLDVLTPHPAVLHYGCTACHDPHATDNPFRLYKPIVQMCTTCHAGFDDGYHVIQRPQGGGHPIGGRDDPLRPGRELVCTSCHDPHGTNNPRMWYRAYTRNALCVECHRKNLAPGTKVGESPAEREAEAQRAKDQAKRQGGSP